MIGIGKWECSVDTMMFRGEGIVTIADKNGEYDFAVEAKGVKMPQYSIDSVTEEGNTLSAVVTTPMLPGKEVPIQMTFDGDVFTGFAKIPLLGKIKFKNGPRIG